MIDLLKTISFPAQLFTKRHAQPVTVTSTADLARYLKAARIAQGISPTALSKQAGTNRSNVYRIERGQNITLETLFAYCGAVGVSIRLEIEED